MPDIDDLMRDIMKMAPDDVRAEFEAKLEESRIAGMAAHMVMTNNTDRVDGLINDLGMQTNGYRLGEKLVALCGVVSSLLAQLGTEDGTDDVRKATALLFNEAILNSAELGKQAMVEDVMAEALRAMGLDGDA